MTQLLVARGAKPGGALGEAVAAKRLEIARFLLDHGADPDQPLDKWNRTPLHRLVYEGGEERMGELLIAHGADVDREAQIGVFLRVNSSAHVRPIHTALRYGRVTLAKALARGGAKLDEFALAGLGMVDELRRDLDGGLSPDARDAGGSPLLTYAATNGQIQTAQLLLDRGANLNPGKQGAWAPLHMAVEARQMVMVQWLLKMGADPNARNSLDETAISRCRDGDIRIILLNHGAQPEAEEPEIPGGFR